MQLHSDTLTFLSDLSQNNDREWFAKQRGRYDEIHKLLKKFAISLVQGLNEFDSIEKHKLFRIYRDVRFSHDKTPYNKHFSISFSRTKPHLRGGYYLRIEPNASLIACGFWNPNPQDLNLIRQNISTDPKRFKKIIKHPGIFKHYGDLIGDEVKTAPKGFSKEHPHIEYIRKKQFVFSKSYLDQQLMSSDFIEMALSDFKAIRPFFDYMSDMLSQDLNGISLY